MSQIIKQTTRRNTRSINGCTQTSETIIDLAFIDDALASKLQGPPIMHNDTITDHFMIEMNFNIAVPSKYVIKSYYLDTTRRPPIKKKDLPFAIEELKYLLDNHIANPEDLSNCEYFQLIEKSLKKILDKYAPMNKSGLHAKKIFRFTLSNATQKLVKIKNSLKNKWRAAKRSNSAEVKIFSNAYKKARNRANCAIRKEKNSQNSSKLYEGIKN